MNNYTPPYKITSKILKLSTQISEEVSKIQFTGIKKVIKKLKYEHIISRVRSLKYGHWEIKI